MKYTEIDILNFVEGRFNDVQTAQIIAEQRTDPALAKAVEAIQASQVPIDHAYQQQRLPPVPESIRNQLDLLLSNYTESDQQECVVENRLAKSTVARENDDELRTAGSVHEEYNSTTRMGKFWMGKFSAYGLAACLVSGIGIGAVTTKLYVQQVQNGSTELHQQVAQPIEQDKHDRLVKRIADYQSLYVENTVAGVTDVQINKAIDLVGSASWTKMRANKAKTDDKGQFGVPDFSAFGYQFVRAQELGFEGQPLIQLVYSKVGFSPLALCFMPDTHVQKRSINLSSHRELTVASWVKKYHHYILVAKEPDSVLTQMHDITSDYY